MPAEALILRAWLKLHAAEYDRFDYNVRVGPGQDPGDAHPDYIRRMAVMNTQRRIDAIGYKGNQATLIEVKATASLTAVGQLLGYKLFWMTDNPSFGPPTLLIVASREAAGTAQVAGEHGIQVEILPVDLSSIPGFQPQAS